MWLQEISQLEDKEINEEIQNMNKDIHNIELRIFAHKLVKIIKNQEHKLVRLSLENIALIRQVERGE